MKYIGVFPDFGGSEDQLSEARLIEFRNICGRILHFYTFSLNFFNGIKFPIDSPKSFFYPSQKRQLGIVPIVRLMPRSDFGEGRPDPIFSLKNILSGKFDSDFLSLARQCKDFDEFALFDFAPEMNGTWFPWSFEDPELYIKCFRKLSTMFKEVAPKSKFAFHINYDHDFENVCKYFPGDEYIDFIGASLYGSHVNGEELQPIEDIYDDTFQILKHLSKKPLAIFELGSCEANKGEKAKWYLDSFKYIKSKNEIELISYWHERYKNGEGYSDFRIDSSPDVLESFKKIINDQLFMHHNIDL